MMKKKLMILGAGIYQVPLINTAKRLGIETIVVSIPGNYPGFAIADKVYYENTVDEEKVLEIAKAEQIDGIVTTGTDVCVGTIGKVCDEMGLYGLSHQAAEIAVNKMLMKTKYEEFGVRTARFRQIAFSNPDIVGSVRELQYPLIFKSVDSSGSRGIIRVDAEEEFESAIAYVKDNTRKDYFLIEEFIEGEEFGAQAFIYKGKVEFILPHGDYVFHGDTGVPIGHFAPYQLSEEAIADAKLQLTNAAKAMGLDNCAINADFIMKDEKTYVLELGGRCGATCLAELVSIYYGFDYYEKIILAAMGEDPDFDITSHAIPNASHLLMSDADGIIKEQLNETPADDRIIDVQFDYQPGEEVHAFRVGPHRLGHIITRGETLEEAQEVLMKAREQVKIILA